MRLGHLAVRVMRSYLGVREYSFRTLVDLKSLRTVIGKAKIKRAQHVGTYASADGRAGV